MADNYFNKLNSIDVSSKVEKKNGLSYLSWSFAWGELKKQFPDATYTVYENASGWNYHTDGKTAWVKVGVTVNGIEHIEYLPVMNYSNKSIPIDTITSFDVNKTIQRALTKAIARHGLGLYIYAGEDLPEDATEVKPVVPKPKEQKKVTAPTPAPKKEEPKKEDPTLTLICADCKKPITAYQGVDAKRIATATKDKYGVEICMECSAKRRAEAEKPKEEPVQETFVDEDGVELPFDLT